MSAIINLYLVPSPGAPPDALPSLVHRLVAEAWVELPAAAGSPYREPAADRVRSPQLLTLPGADGVRPVADRPGLDAELDRAQQEPVLLAFAALNAAHPDVRREFDHYRGFDCAVGFYAFPAGHHLKLAGEELLGAGDERPVFDRTVRCWCQLSGKAAVWESLFRGSALERVVQAVWPGHEVVEHDWA